MKETLFIGTFPPPVHGMATVNQALFERLAFTDMTVEKLSTAPKNLDRDVFSRLSRLIPVCKAWLRLLTSHPTQKQLYIALSGGWGQIYDMVSLSIARTKKMRSIIHHHSFAYLQKKRIITTVLLRVAGKGAMHVVACGTMGNLLQDQYGINNIFVLSNLVFFPPEPYTRSRQKLGVIGFLSNITKEKGGEMILDLALMIKNNRMPLKVIIAGPCYDDVLTLKLRQAVSNNILEWRGAIYGADKENFWQDIDVFVFPTQNEAEPLVLWESFAAGVPIITYQRGCIQEQVGNAGVLISQTDDFVQKALDTLERWNTHEAEYHLYVKQALERYRSLQEQSLEQWQELVDIITFEKEK